MKTLSMFLCIVIIFLICIPSMKTQATDTWYPGKADNDTSDEEWSEAVVNGFAMIKEDISLISASVNSVNNKASVKGYNDALAEDAGNALQDSQSYMVSPLFQNVKNYFELSFASYQIGAQKISQALDPNAVNVMQMQDSMAMLNDGITDISKGNDYRELAMKTLNASLGFP